MDQEQGLLLRGLMARAGVEDEGIVGGASSFPAASSAARDNAYRPQVELADETKGTPNTLSNTSGTMSAWRRKERRAREIVGSNPMMSVLVTSGCVLRYTLS